MLAHRFSSHPVDGTGIFGGLVAALAAYGTGRGLNLQQLTKASGLTPAQIVDPEARVSDASVLAIWSLLETELQDVNLPLSLARAAPASVFGGIAEGARYADTIGGAIGLVQRNQLVIADRMSLDIQALDTGTQVTLHHPLDHKGASGLAAFGTALFSRLISEYLETPGAIGEVQLTLPHVEEPNSYRQFFQARVTLGAPCSVVVLKPGVWDARCRHANETLFNYVEEHFRQTRTRLEGRIWPDSLSALRKSITDNAARNDYSTASAAAGANMSLRTAQRIAAKEGYVLQGMINAVRMENAMVLLENSSMRMERIAFQLGYSDDRAFRRAFKRLIGQSPTQYRQSKLGRRSRL